MRIIHLSASDKGGAFKMADKLVKHQNANGLMAHHAIFTGNLSNIEITGINFLDKIYKFCLHAFEKFIFLFYEKSKDKRFKFSFGYPGVSVKLLKKLTQGFDIIHIHWINKGFININDLHLLNKPIVWTTHDIWIATGGCHLTMGCNHFEKECGNCLYLKRPYPNDLSFDLFKIKKQVVSNFNVAFVAPSVCMFNNLKNSPITQSKYLHNIPNGIDTSIFKNIDLLRNEVFTIGFVAANLNDENKALFRLANAINLSVSNFLGIKVKLILIGEKKENFKFNFNCAIEQVSFVKNEHEMVNYYNQMDLLAVTSTIETLPTTIIEAGCCGTPSIAFNVGGISDVISSENGILIEAFDESEFSKSLHYLTKNAMDREEISSFMKQKFSLKNVSEAYLKVYNSF